MFHFFNKKQKNISKAQNGAATTRKPFTTFVSNAIQTVSSPHGPFPNKHESRTDVVIQAAEFHLGASNEKAKQVLETLQKDQAGGKAKIEFKVFHREVDTNTLTLPGYQLMSLNPKIRFSRMRNIEADNWRDQAFTKADGFVYIVDLAAEDQYLSHEEGRSKGWERDRFLVTSLLREPSLVENPTKPLLLLADQEFLTEEFDMQRIVNLLGLGSIRRPFRAMSYSTENAEKLKEGLEWLKRTAGSVDEATAMTESETEDEQSIATQASTMFSDDYVLDYEPTLLGGNPTLQRFEPVKKGTHCAFAKAAKLWGGKLIDESTPRRYMAAKSLVEEAAALNVGPLAEFVARSSGGQPLDGFCMEIPSAAYVNVERLGEYVCHVLTKLAELDPNSRENAMKMGTIDHPHWRFRFAGEDFFVTTFSPVYKQDSSRFAFGAKNAFLLFQPMTSFGRHGLVEDTPASATNWKNPTSLRDKTRVAFKTNGCPYHIPEELPYPVAEHIVKPEKDDGTTCIRWWDNLQASKSDDK